MEGAKLFFFLVTFPAKINVEMWGAGSVCECFVRQLGNNIFYQV